MLNTNKIKGRMREMGVTQAVLAKELGITQATCCLKLNNLRATSLDEANIIAKKLEISSIDFGKYFFA